MQLTPLDQLIGKTIVIVGLGAEGRSTYQFVRDLGTQAKIILVDDKQLTQLDLFWQQVGTEPGTEFLHSSRYLDQRDAATALLFKTPGIPVTHPFMAHALQQGAQLISNTQLFFELVESYNQLQGHQPLTIIGITGTKGKSTTTSCIYHLLETAGETTYLGGNIGKPALDVWQAWQQAMTTPAYFVMELSAHQLAELPYSPHVAVVQDIVPEHLDYYATFDEYRQAKSSITRYQTAQEVVLFNADSPTATSLADLSPGEKLSFAIRRTDADCKPQDLTGISILLVGTHNLYNVLPTVLVGRLLNIPQETVRNAISTFTSLPHRLQLVGEVNGVRYYDDSIATTPEAAMAALEAFTDTPIILVAGGHDRHLDYSQLADAILNHAVKAVALFPPTGERLKTLLEEKMVASAEYQPLPILKSVTTMTEAVNFAHAQAQPGDVVLLSPAAASFGMFKDYADRGDQFKKLVNEYLLPK